MKIPLKSPEEIEIMQEGGKKLSRILRELIKMAKPGVKLADIEKKAQHLIKKAGGEPSFTRVPNYKWATCINVNDGIVHGIPDETKIKQGDVVSIDIGLLYKGFNTDMCQTLCVQDKRYEIKDKKYEGKEKFLKTGKKALEDAIGQAKVGNRVGHISQAIQRRIEDAGYSCIRNLTGHGIGKKLHEPPQIPCFLNKKIKETSLLENGTTLAIEVIYAIGDCTNYTKMDGWTIAASNGKIATVFEKTIAVTNDGSLILTEF